MATSVLCKPFWFKRLVLVEVGAVPGASGNPGGCWAFGTGGRWERMRLTKKTPALGFTILAILLPCSAGDGRGCVLWRILGQVMTGGDACHGIVVEIPQGREWSDPSWFVCTVPRL